ncbi:NAD dependent epimerase/dehydratase family protein [Klebsiella pneumoniae]|uniref:NAD dependent epimerase/dehydratase family protein n=1 Tax=Klebsiella pneumoniae TaxID=573 RepID=A0A2X3KPP9_KLEPN|nr:NAD dependent epimerase/dehydratase family protein [Klebsiella pneumoniae]
MSQSVLVLGASGYIGQHLVRELSARGYPVLAAARHIDRLQKLAVAPALPAGQSISISRQDLPALLTGIVPFIIWSTAWAKAVILSPMSGGWRRMCADALRQSSVRQVIFLSSLQAPAQEQSDHLCARQITGDLLRESGVPGDRAAGPGLSSAPAPPPSR